MAPVSNPWVHLSQTCYLPPTPPSIQINHSVFKAFKHAADVHTRMQQHTTQKILSVFIYYRFIYFFSFFCLSWICWAFLVGHTCFHLFLCAHGFIKHVSLWLLPFNSLFHLPFWSKASIIAHRMNTVAPFFLVIHHRHPGFQLFA